MKGLISVCVVLTAFSLSGGQGAVTGGQLYGEYGDATEGQGAVAGGQEAVTGGQGAVTGGQEAVAGGHHLVCTVQSWIVLPSLGEDVRMGATSLLQVLLHDPDLVLVLLGVVLDMLPQAARVSVPLAAPNHLASVWLL